MNPNPLSQFLTNLSQKLSFEALGIGVYDFSVDPDVIVDSEFESEYKVSVPFDIAELELPLECLFDADELGLNSSDMSSSFLIGYEVTGFTGDIVVANLITIGSSHFLVRRSSEGIYAMVRIEFSDDSVPLSRIAAVAFLFDIVHKVIVHHPDPYSLVLHPDVSIEAFASEMNFLIASFGSKESHLLMNKRLLAEFFLDLHPSVISKVSDPLVQDVFDYLKKSGNAPKPSLEQVITAFTRVIYSGKTINL
jgi:hypothetical protein